MASSRKEPAAKRPPARTPEDRERQLVSLAVDLAEKQLRDGTASTAVITHYLKASSPREGLERKKLTKENQLLEAKYNEIEQGREIKKLYAGAIKAMRAYQGEEQEDDDEDQVV